MAVDYHSIIAIEPGVRSGNPLSLTHVLLSRMCVPIWRQG
jgi:hypothetical protein